MTILSASAFIDEALLQGRKGPLLFVGPAYSGKSEWSLKALRAQKATAVIGTAPSSNDPLMVERLSMLRSHHPAESLLVENVTSLASALHDIVANGYTQILVDSVSHWIPAMVLDLGNRYDLAQIHGILARELADFIAEIVAVSSNAELRLVIVSSEMGSSVVPREAASRFVRHMVGIYNQKLAQCCNDVFMLSCGIPLWIKTSA